MATNQPTVAVGMSDVGMGDYWDDVDAIVRNELTEQQFVDPGRMRKLTGDDPKNDALLKRIVGGFGESFPTVLNPGVWGCCSANGANALYYAWHGITRFDHGVATVNLFLNRASPWLDIDSYLPYEGKVVLHNKQAQTILIRIAGWLGRGPVKCFVNQKAVDTPMAGHYLLFERLKKKDEICLEFPMLERKDKYTIHDKEYTISFRGSTVMDIEPRNTDPKSYPIYQRERLKGTKAPMHLVRRFVADRLIPLP